MGPAGAGLTTYGYVYNLDAGSVVDGGDDIVFNSNGPLFGITHAAGTPDIVVPNTADYQIDYSVSTTDGSGAAIAIAVNGTVDASTNRSLLASPGEVNGTAILSLTSGDVIALRNDSAIPMTLAAPPNIGAQLNMIQLQ
jgi:hypothetical protein